MPFPSLPTPQLPFIVHLLCVWSLLCLLLCLCVHFLCHYISHHFCVFILTLQEVFRTGKQESISLSGLALPAFALAHACLYVSPL